MTACAPSSAALEIAIVMPRSLKEPVGLAPSTLSSTSQPVRSDSTLGGHQRRAALQQRDHRGRRGDRQPVAVLLDDAAPLVGGQLRSVDCVHRVTPLPPASRWRPRARCRARAAPRRSPRARVGAPVGDDDQRARPGVAVAAVPAWRTVSIDTPCSAKTVRHLGQHARLVGHVEADVVARARPRPSGCTGSSRVRRLARPGGARRPGCGRPPTRSPSTALAVGAPPAPGP